MAARQREAEAIRRWRLGQIAAARRKLELSAEEGPNPAQAVAEALAASSVSADEASPTPVEDVCDEQGVDRSQIRAFLELTPRQRIDRASRSAAFFLRVRKLNDRTPPVRDTRR